MTFEHFLELNERFVGLSINEQICRVAWFLHRHSNVDRFNPSQITGLYKQAHLSPPQASVYLPRLADKRPAPILWDKRGYFLEGRERKRLDDLLLPKRDTADVSKLLRDLSVAISDGPERVFLDEALRCYEVTAFRAAIVMTWNLAYSHLSQWILRDAERLAKFNHGSAVRFSKNPKPAVLNLEDFENFKESEFLDASRTGNVLNKNLDSMLREKLKRRNMAAHPSIIVIQQPQADDVITDLIQNVVLAL